MKDYQDCFKGISAAWDESTSLQESTLVPIEQIFKTLTDVQKQALKLSVTDNGGIELQHKKDNSTWFITSNPDSTITIERQPSQEPKHLVFETTNTSEIVDFLYLIL